MLLSRYFLACLLHLHYSSKRKTEVKEEIKEEHKNDVNASEYFCSSRLSKTIDFNDAFEVVSEWQIDFYRYIH
jgi:hypothetical protein